MPQLEHRVCVITGGGRGIGRALAYRFAREGGIVVVSSRTSTDLSDVVDTIERSGGVASLVVADATDPAGARAPVEQALERYGAVDVLVNNVGGTIGRGHDPLHVDASDDGFERTLVLNLTSAWWTTCAALPGMRDRSWGRVINIGSGAAKGTGGSIAYTAAKHGLVGLTKQTALRVGEYGITVNCLCPGWTNTSLIDWEAIAGRRGVTAEAAEQEAARENAQRRILEPDELAGMAVLLASEDGAGITGQVISVDGGYRL
jgi:NAD(P)-dependent dehydrogenase (short-subunit alcohol dehydrogenase family)